MTLTNIVSGANATVGPLDSWTYAYDALDQLTQATNAGGGLSQSFTYDRSQNMLTNSQAPGPGGSPVNTYSYPAPGSSAVRPHAPESVNGEEYKYDATGNLTSGAGRDYTWDADGRLSTLMVF